MIIKGTNVKIPDSLIVPGYLDLRNTDVTELPAGLRVGAWLDLRYVHMDSLPEGINVGGWLDLYGANIKKLPNVLTVGGVLNLMGTEIQSLPDGICADNVYADDGQLIASEKVQLAFIEKNKSMFYMFKAPTEKAHMLHQILWEI